MISKNKSESASDGSEGSQTESEESENGDYGLEEEESEAREGLIKYLAIPERQATLWSSSSWLSSSPVVPPYGKVKV